MQNMNSLHMQPHPLYQDHMTQAGREHLLMEMDQLWQQSMMKPWTHANLSYWIREINRRIDKLRPELQDEEAQQVSFHNQHRRKLQRGLNVLSRA